MKYKGTLIVVKDCNRALKFYRDMFGLKAVKLDKFVAIANALDVSADRLLVDVVTRSVDGVANELSQEVS